MNSLYFTIPKWLIQYSIILWVLFTIALLGYWESQRRKAKKIKISKVILALDSMKPSKEVLQ